MDEYKVWANEHDEAKAARANRSALVDASAEKIERQLLLLGATAIEDKLQQVCFSSNKKQASYHELSYYMSNFVSHNRFSSVECPSDLPMPHL